MTTPRRSPAPVTFQGRPSSATTWLLALTRTTRWGFDSVDHRKPGDTAGSDRVGATVVSPSLRGRTVRRLRPRTCRRRGRGRRSWDGRWPATAPWAWQQDRMARSVLDSGRRSTTCRDWPRQSGPTMPRRRRGIRDLTPLFWSHANPYGDVQLNMRSRLRLNTVND